MSNEQLHIKLETLPENLRSEVADFIDFLLSKAEKKNENTERPTPVFGSAKGMFKMNIDVDEPLNDFKDYMN
ncbi:MAG: hypothetical protein JWP81_2414 [Ferruginibacter sp.]|nr:hypothetical protein [Ferruginibacter sp.]